MPLGLLCDVLKMFLPKASPFLPLHPTIAPASHYCLWPRAHRYRVLFINKTDCHLGKKLCTDVPRHLDDWLAASLHPQPGQT